MRRVALLFAMIIGMSLIASGAPQKRLAVLDFEYGLVRDQVDAIFSTDVDVGRGMRDLVVKHLVRDGTYTIVELKDLENLFDEQGLTAGHLKRTDTFARITRVFGVDALVMGTVTEFGGDTTERKLTLGGIFGTSGGTLQLDKVHGAVAVNVRMVDLGSGEIIAVSEGHGASRRTATSLLAGLFAEGGVDLGTLDFSARDFENTALGEAVHSAAEQVAAGLIAANNKVQVRSTNESGPVTEIIAGILANELEEHKATGIYDDKGIDPSNADLRIGRTIYIRPMPYDLHIRIAALLSTNPQPLFVVCDDPRKAELWMLGTVRYSERPEVGPTDSWGEEPNRFLARRLTASLVIVPRRGAQRLAYAETKGYIGWQDKMAKNLVGKLKKSVSRK